MHILGERVGQKDALDVNFFCPLEVCVVLLHEISANRTDGIL